jgi:hypothetical protein
VPDGEKSLTWIVVMIMVCIALFGWGFLAGSYTGAYATNMSEMTSEQLKELSVRTPSGAGRGAIVAFVGNALVQLPNFPAVISWHLSNRVWLPLTIIALEAGALLGAVALKKVESALETPRRRR